MVGKRRLTKATIAVATATRIAESIPNGEIIEICHEPDEGSRMIDVLWEGRPMMMFIQDLLDRGEEVLDNDQPRAGKRMSASG
jgi:hypothetical protein